MIDLVMGKQYNNHENDSGSCGDGLFDTRQRYIKEDHMSKDRVAPENIKTDLQKIKDSNPKDSIGIKKVALSCVSAPVLMEMALGMQEGAMKYGRHNYRVIGVRASVYYDATMRHLMAYWEGEDIDPDSGLSHLSKARSEEHTSELQSLRHLVCRL